MKNIAENIEQIIKRLEPNNAKFEQISKLDDTLKSLQSVSPIDKPSYIFPQIDTIGKNTYSSLNKK